MENITIEKTIYENMKKNNRKLSVHIEVCEDEIRKMQKENYKLKTEINQLYDAVGRIQREANNCF